MTTLRILRPAGILFFLLWAAAHFVGAQEAPAATSAGDSADPHLGKGYEAMKQENYAAAIPEFRAALALDPKLVLKARFPLAVALFESHQPEEARHEFEAVSREVGDHPNISYYLGRLDLEARNLPSAIRNLTAAAAKPPFPDTTYYLGFACLQQNDLAGAEKWLKEAAQAMPHDSRVPYQLAAVYRKQGRADDAQKALDLSAELRRNESSESQLKLDCAQKLESGPREDALALCEQLDDPSSPEKLTALGTIYGQHKELDAALKPLRRAAELAPQSPQMQYNLSLLYFQMGRFEDARAPLAGALQRWPDLFQLNFLYGAVLLKLGENLAAYQPLHHARQLNPKDSETTDLLYRLTLALSEKSQARNDFAPAIRYLEEAAALRPQEAEPHRRMALIHSLAGNPAKAAAEQHEADRLSKASGSS